MIATSASARRSISCAALRNSSGSDSRRYLRLARQVSKRVCSSSNSAGIESTIEYLPKSRLSIDGEHIENTLGNHARLPKGYGATTVVRQFAQPARIARSRKSAILDFATDSVDCGRPGFGQGRRGECVALRNGRL